MLVEEKQRKIPLGGSMFGSDEVLLVWCVCAGESWEFG